MGLLNDLLQALGRLLAAPSPAPLGVGTVTAADPVLRPQPATHQEAAQRLVNRQVVNSVGYRNRLLDADRTGAHPDLVRWALAFLDECQRRGFPIFPHCWVRSDQEQAKLLAKRVTNAGPGQSPHNFGLAVDLVDFTRGWQLTEKEWAILGEIGKDVARRTKVKVEWGGDWSFYDPAHWQLAGWKQLKGWARNR